MGAIQCTVSLGRLYFNIVTITLASFRDEPIQGHLDGDKLLVSYVVNFKHDTIKISPEEPNLSSIPITPYD